MDGEGPGEAIAKEQSFAWDGQPSVSTTLTTTSPTRAGMRFFASDKPVDRTLTRTTKPTPSSRSTPTPAHQGSFPICVLSCSLARRADPTSLMIHLGFGAKDAEGDPKPQMFDLERGLSCTFAPFQQGTNVQNVAGRITRRCPSPEPCTFRAELQFRKSMPRTSWPFRSRVRFLKRTRSPCRRSSCLCRTSRRRPSRAWL
jgi:hypothetical protein